MPWVHRLTEIDTENRTAVCANCGPVGIRVEKDRSPRCKGQIAEYAKAYARANKRRVKYGITDEEYAEYRERQQGQCAICREELTGKGTHGEHTDHDHQTGAVRGILCRGCNHGLGNFRDDPTLLFAAIEYIQNAKPPHSEE